MGTAENTGSVHGHGIYLMKALVDEVRFEEGGVVVHMRNRAGRSAAKDAQKKLAGVGRFPLTIRNRYREHL